MTISKKFVNQALIEVVQDYLPYPGQTVITELWDSYRRIKRDSERKDMLLSEIIDAGARGGLVSPGGVVVYRRDGARKEYKNFRGNLRNIKKWLDKV